MQFLALCFGHLLQGGVMEIYLKNGLKTTLYPMLRLLLLDGHSSHHCSSMIEKGAVRHSHLLFATPYQALPVTPRQNCFWSTKDIPA